MRFWFVFVLLSCSVFTICSQTTSPAIELAKQQLFSKMEMQLCGYEFVHDGVLDEFGNFIYTNSGLPQNGWLQGLNCTGFAKYVADFLYKRLQNSKEGLTVSQLKRRFTGLRTDMQAQQYEYELDPFFAQDWIRNIGLALNGTPTADGDSWDITEVEGLDFDNRWGFRADDIELLAGKLERKYPESVFFFSVAKVLDRELEIRQFAHAGMMVVVRNSAGLDVAFFESNIVNTLPRFSYNNSGRYIWLVRVDISDLLQRELLSDE